MRRLTVGPGWERDELRRMGASTGSPILDNAATSRFPQCAIQTGNRSESANPDHLHDDGSVSINAVQETKP